MEALNMQKDRKKIAAEMRSQEKGKPLREVM